MQLDSSVKYLFPQHLLCTRGAFTHSVLKYENSLQSTCLREQQILFLIVGSCAVGTDECMQIIVRAGQHMTARFVTFLYT